MEFIQKIAAFLMHYTWDIALGEYDESIITQTPNIFDKIHIIKNPYRKKWFADPFILKRDGTLIHLLVEEFDSDVSRGRIAHIEVDTDIWSITSCKIILELPTHLSFPAIYRIGPKVYVHPENSASGNSYIYEYDQDNDLLINPILLSDLPLNDAVIQEKSGEYIMTATENPTPNGNVMTILESHDFLGPYKKISEVVLKTRIARMAGYYLETKKGLLRPAQDCNGDYGKSVLFMKNYEEMSKLVPNNYRYSGIHTFNTGDGLFVIDLKKQDFPFVYKIRTLVKSLLHMQ